jgi:hypothetical protein
MALYRVHFLDDGDNVGITHHVDHDDDAAAIEAAHRLNVLPHMNAGFGLGRRTTGSPASELGKISRPGVRAEAGRGPTAAADRAERRQSAGQGAVVVAYSRGGRTCSTT